MIAAYATLAFFGFASVAGMTFFFSSRPRAFIRTFVPCDEYRDVVRPMLRDPNFCRGMRRMAYLQFGVAAIIGMIALWFCVMPP